MKKRVISDAALRVLSSAEYITEDGNPNNADGGLLLLPPGQLERNLYVEVNKVLENFGGKWNKKQKAHYFPNNPMERINDAILTGDYAPLDKNGYFPTPMPIAYKMIELFKQPKLDRVLEPNCADGNLVDAVLTKRQVGKLVVVEPNKDLLFKTVEKFHNGKFGGSSTETLTYCNQTFEEFFADYINSTHSGLFDAIIMNPPFERGQDAAHITMAIQLLKDGGELTAICSLGLQFRQDAGYKTLREFLESNGAEITELPEASFKESGTMVRTVLIYYKHKKENQIIMATKTKDTKKETKQTKKAAAAAGKVETPETVTQTVFRIEQTGGTSLTEVSRDEAMQDVLKNDSFTADAVNSMFDNGEVVFSENFYYSTDNAKLTPFISENTESGGGGNDADTATAAAGELTYEMDNETPVAATTESTPAPSGKSKKTATAKATKSSRKNKSDNSPKGDSQSVENGDSSLESQDSKESDAGENTPELKGITVTRDDGVYKAGDKVVDRNRHRLGTIVEQGDHLGVRFQNPDNQKWYIAQFKENWTRAEESDIQALMIVDNSDAIQGEVIEPLTEEEKAKLTELETQYEQLDQAEAQIPFHKGRILNEIRQNKLHRQHGTFREYAFARFGITREYAQRLARIGGFKELADGAFEEGQGVNMSVRVADGLIDMTKRIAEKAGLTNSEMEAAKPVITTAMQLLVDSVKDEQGNPLPITPRLVSKFAEVLERHVTAGVVEIEPGKQMSVMEASAKGLLGTSLQAEVLAETAESIKAHAQTIREDFIKSKDARETNIEADKKKSSSGGGGQQKYTGKAPELTVECSKHGAQKIVSIGAGVFQTSCACRWRISSETKALVCYEIQGKQVVESKK